MGDGVDTPKTVMATRAPAVLKSNTTFMRNKVAPILESYFALGKVSPYENWDIFFSQTPPGHQSR